MSHKERGTSGAQSIAPTVYDKRPQMEYSVHRLMGIFWVSDVAIQFGKGAGRFYRPADKEDIAKLFMALIARFKAGETYPPFARGVTKMFCNMCSAARRSHLITLHWWQVRMMRELATIPNMMDATNRFPNKDLLQSVTHHATNLRKAGFGRFAKLQAISARKNAKPVTLAAPAAEKAPAIPTAANTQEEETAA